MAPKRDTLATALLSAAVLGSPGLWLPPSPLCEGAGIQVLEGWMPYDVGPRLGFIPKAPSSGIGNILLLLSSLERVWE